ncbi:MAG TPA: T9SS type A sorting domain-containing protein [Ignavibacteriales bacterium]|nr:T9SS type A sorting domain-containing protein [Ignavibacteriales bacterium]
MKKLALIILVLNVALFAWGGPFAISCVGNSWPNPTGISGLDAQWKFQGEGNSPATNSPNKLLFLTGSNSLTYYGNFYFRVIHLEGSAWYSWGGVGSVDESVALNSVSNINCPGGNYQDTKAAYFSMTNDKKYALLFQANPNSGGNISKITVLEFDGDPVQLINQSHILGTTLDLTLTLSAEPPADQKFYVRYVWDGSNDWANATIEQLTVSGTNATKSINVSGHSSITYYYFTTESNVSVTNSNVDDVTLYYLNNNGGNYTVGALPVELTSISISFKDNAILLTWQTATEVNNKGFEIEKFVNNSWQNIGFVKGKGNSSVVNNYKFEDKTFIAGKNVYRLKQVDNNGVFKYYEPVEIEVVAPKAFELFNNYPNPFNPTTNIRFAIPEKSVVKIGIYNIKGELVRLVDNSEYEAGVHSKNIDMSGFASGVYFVKLSAGNNTKTIKINLMK